MAHLAGPVDSGPVTKGVPEEKTEGTTGDPEETTGDPEKTIGDPKRKEQVITEGMSTVSRRERLTTARHQL